MARPTKLTPAVHQAVVEALRKGLPLDTVADKIGIEQATMRDWIARGKGTSRRPPSEEFVAFAEDVARARAEFEENVLDNIRTAVTPGEFGVTDVKAQMWLAERLRPDKYGQSVQVRMKVDAELNGILEKLRTGLDQATFERVVDILADDGASEDREGTPSDSDG